MKRRLLILVLLSLGVFTIQAQRIGCIHTTNQSATRSDVLLLPLPMDFNPQKTYRQPVVLISFSDTDFSMDNPKDYYDRLFNEQGFSRGYGIGSVADYFRDQSGGRLNLQFDVYGPFKVDATAGGHGIYYYGYDAMLSAIEKLYETETSDFSVYDWNGDGRVNQVLFVAAGYSGHQCAGYIWPNTGEFCFNLPGDISSYYYSVTSELWNDASLCGIGIIAHEFCHCLGLPDIYPMSPATMYSVADEWDLMDGGDYINKGWCPSNLTAMEKMYLKWDMPEELTEPTTITGMKSVSAGGKTYIIRNSGNPNEFYLLENRQQEGWDYGCPGNGLLITHVDYELSSWVKNMVNISDFHYRYDLFHADGMDYRAWDRRNNGKDPRKYTMPDCMRNRYLSTSTYPYTDPLSLVVNQMLTNESEPASTVFNENAEGEFFMSKSISNIQMASDGTISFDFMKESTGIKPVAGEQQTTGSWYDLQGRKLTGKPTRKGVYIVNKKKVAF